MSTTPEPGDSQELQHTTAICSIPFDLTHFLIGEDIGPWQTFGQQSLMYIGPVSVTSFTRLSRLLPLQVSSHLAGRPCPQSEPLVLDLGVDEVGILGEHPANLGLTHGLSLFSM